MRKAVQRLDPAGVDARKKRQIRKRGCFIVKGPNRVWSIDGHDKLSRFGFRIYGAIDAYSRYIIWCFIGHSNRTAVSVNKQYLTAVRQLGVFPKLIRSDKGTETTLLCNSHLSLRRAEQPDLPLSKAYSYGTSTKNQRIESWWNLLANAQTDTWRAIFVDLEETGFFDGGDIDVICLQYIYMEMVTAHIQGFVRVHNTHRIRRQRNQEHYLPTGRPCEMYHYPPNEIRDYGHPPPEEILSILEEQVAAYNLDTFLTPETHSICCQLLELGGFANSFQFSDNHREAYIYLREALSQYSLAHGGEISVLPTPAGADKWILEHQTTSQLDNIDSGGETAMKVDLTDCEEDIAFDEELIVDADDEEYDMVDKDENGSKIAGILGHTDFDCELFTDDGYLLNI